MALTTINVADFEWQIIMNPNACERKNFDEWPDIIAKLEQHNIRYKIHYSDGSHAGIKISKNLCRDGYRYFMVVGGDGTINEVVNGIFGSRVNTNEVFLAVIPHGRGNDWARTHHFPVNQLDTIDGFLKGNFTPHDIGLTKVYQEGDMLEQRYFLNINSYCYSAEVIYETIYNKPLFKKVSVYLLRAITTLFKFKFKKITINSNEFQYEGLPFMMVVAICQYNGGGMRQAPQAQYDDGLFDVVIIPKISKMTVIRKIKYIFTGEHLKMIEGVRFFRTNKLVIDSSPYILGEMEGELLAQGRYEIEMLPSSLNILTFNQQ